MNPSESIAALKSICWPDVLGTTCLELDKGQLQQLTYSLSQHARRCIRINPRLHPNALPFSTSPVPWYSQGRWLDDPNIRPGAFLHYAAGDYYIQDAASLLALKLCDVQPGDVVCDLCAAPGGKATGLLEQLGGQGFLLANEVISSRLPILLAALHRSGYCNHATSNQSVDLLADSLPESFDCVLVDAPCSGQSMVGRDKQSLSAFTPTQIDHNAARQSKIIRQAARLVRPGGKIVYSTCTFSVAENEAIIEDFINEHPDWTILADPALLAWCSPRLPGSYRLWPHRDHCDGGFAVALQLRSQQASSMATHESAPLISNLNKIEAQRSKRSKPNTPQWSTFTSIQDLDQFLHIDVNTLPGSLLRKADQIHFLHTDAPAEIPQITSSLVPIAEVSGSRISPLYASAMATLAGLHPTYQLNIDAQQALAYVRGESLRLGSGNYRQAWHQVLWEGRPLSWGKLSQDQLKNHFPKILRSTGIQAGSET